MKVNVIGLGATAKDFKPDGSITIGVNDVQGTDAIVCVDRIAAFSTERAHLIFSNVTATFFSHIEDWQSVPMYKHIDLKAVHAHNNRWNEFIPSSNNSPFVACGVAYKYFNATEIYLWGVDFNDHPNINGAMREQAVIDFALLQKILNKKGCKIIPHEKSYLFGKV